MMQFDTHFLVNTKQQFPPGFCLGTDEGSVGIDLHHCQSQNPGTPARSGKPGRTLLVKANI
jgi:hypothetical protein